MPKLHLLAAVAALVPHLSPSEAADVKDPPVQISVEEIGKNAVLVGRLKKPLGTMMTVRGKWFYPPLTEKDYSPRFLIREIDGVKLDRPIELNVAQCDVVTKTGEPAIPPHERRKELEGKEWTLRAFEAGRFADIPTEYWKERGSGPHAAPYWYGVFTTELRGVLQP
jgi:hypothetical protein